MTETYQVALVVIVWMALFIYLVGTGRGTAAMGLMFVSFIGFIITLTTMVLNA